MGEYRYEELECGCKTLNIDSIDGFKRKLPELRAQYADPAKFKELYKFVFDFSKDAGFKNVSLDTAVALWDLLLKNKCLFLKDWIAFLTEEKKEL